MRAIADETLSDRAEIEDDWNTDFSKAPKDGRRILLCWGYEDGASIGTAYYAVDNMCWINPLGPGLGIVGGIWEWKSPPNAWKLAAGPTSPYIRHLSLYRGFGHSED